VWTLYGCTLPSISTSTMASKTQHGEAWEGIGKRSFQQLQGLAPLCNNYVSCLATAGVKSNSSHRLQPILPLLVALLFGTWCWVYTCIDDVCGLLHTTATGQSWQLAQEFVPSTCMLCTVGYCTALYHTVMCCTVLRCLGAPGIPTSPGTTSRPATALWLHMSAMTF
jgi:hypothetical protein